MSNIDMIYKAFEMMNSGLSLRKTAAELGIPVSTLSFWKKKVTAACGSIEQAFSEKENKGGRPRSIQFNDKELALAKWFRLAKESVDIAAYFFARDEHVRVEIKEAIIAYEERSLETGKRIAWPSSVRKAFHVTDEERAAFRGKKASQQVEMITRRGMFEVLVDGSVAKIAPGNTWELDDYSTNQPFVYENPDDGEKMLGRQVLACRDLASASWLGFDHIGRERDAYRSEDVVRFIERLVRTHGLPARLRLERGIWESSGVHGIEVPGMSTRWGDLRDIMEIEHVFKSKSKSIIEGGFNMLQRWLAHTGTDIGRTRGEFEEATKRYLKSKRKNVDPETLGFLLQEKSSKLHYEAGKLINSRPMQRDHLNERVSPDDLIAREGWECNQLDDADAWYFLPCKQLRIVRAGHVEVNPGGGWPRLTFTINGISEGIHLENGHKILVACDPLHPERGAYICNADQSVKNRHHYGMGEHLLVAKHLGLSPQFNAAAELTPHLVARKKATAAASTTFRAITTAAKSPRELTTTDGKGRKATLSTLSPAQKKVKPESEELEAESETIQRSPAPVPQNRRTPSEPVTMSRFGGRDAAAEIAKLTASLEEQ